MQKHEIDKTHVMNLTAQGKFQCIISLKLNKTKGKTKGRNKQSTPESKTLNQLLLVLSHDYMS